MKTRTMIHFALFVACGLTVQAQTADDYITQGRTFLTRSNIVAANNSFSNALVLAPNHGTANVFYAFTRLLAWPQSRPGSNFLSRLGIPAAGRSIYNWTALPPEDTNGVVLAPAGVNANEAAAMLRTNILFEIAGAQTNLAKITNTNFILTVTSNETRMSDVTLDYGDVCLLRSMLQGGKYFCYTTYSWNMDVNLEAIRALYTNGLLSLERVLMDYPNLLTYATTNDLSAAKSSFTNAVDRYVEGSFFIRNRSTNVVRLFNYDDFSAEGEQKFRQTLLDLKHSVTGAVVLAADTNYTVFLGAHFSGLTPLRTFLPDIRENGFVLATLPDPTFGGLVRGVNPDDVDGTLAHLMFPIPRFSPVISRVGPGLSFPLHVAPGRGYVLQWSTDLMHWQDQTAFFALEPARSFIEPDALVLARRFYRIVDRTEDMPPPPNDNFVNSIAFSGLGIIVMGYNASATVETGEPEPPGPSVWWSWTVPVSGPVIVSTMGSTTSPLVQIYTGSSLGSLNFVSNGDQVFHAVAGTTYHIRAVNWWSSPGGIKLTMTDGATVTVQTPHDGAILQAPTNLVISAGASYFRSTLKELTIYADGNPLGSTTNSFLSVTLSNVAPGTHYLQVRAIDTIGIPTYSNLFVTVRPPNDDFARRTAIPAAGGTVTGSNAGATKEPDEPDHAGNIGGASVWWSWTPSTNGAVTIVASMSAPGDYYSYSYYPLLGVYTGSSVSSLTCIASNTPPDSRIPAQVSFNAVGGTTYKIAVDEQWGNGGDITLKIIRTAPPTVTITAPSDDAVIPGPTNVYIAATASDPDGTVTQVDFYRQVEYGPITLLRTFSAPPYSLTWSNVPLGLGNITLRAKATDNNGVSTFSPHVSFRVTPSNDSFANRISLAGTDITTTGSNQDASKEPGEPDHAGVPGAASVWWSWTSPFNGVVTMSAAMTAAYGYTLSPVLAVYTGNSVSSLSVESSSTPDYGGSAQVAFNATAGTTYQIAVDSYYGGAEGNITLRIVRTEPPSVSMLFPADGQSFFSSSPTNIPLLATATDIDGTIQKVEFYRNYYGSATLIATVTNAPYSAIWNNVSLGNYTLLARAMDNTGVSTYSSPINITVVTPPPPNDNFANRIFLTGATVSTTGSNAGATEEEYEPLHAGYWPAKSLWWSWTAPSSGAYTLNVSSTEMYYPTLAVYTGTTLQNLAEVNSAGGYQFTAQVTFTATAGQAYQLVLDDPYGYGGSYTLTLSP